MVGSCGAGENVLGGVAMPGLEEVAALSVFCCWRFFS
jgi:hypothetical protein